MRGDGQQVAQRRGEESGELLLREEFEEGGLQVVDAVLQGGQELHGRLHAGGSTALRR